MVGSIWKDGCRIYSSLGTRTTPTCGTAAVTWMDRPSRPNLSSALRQLPSDCAFLASDGNRCPAHHVEAYPFKKPQRVLGATLESGFSSTGSRIHLPSFTSPLRSRHNRISGLHPLGTDSRPGYLGACPSWLWSTNSLLRNSRIRRCDRAQCTSLH